MLTLNNGDCNLCERSGRYLNAVGEHLPARNRTDMLAELRANPESEIEGREEEFGRVLTGAEVAQVLEAHGMPVLVAARYGPQQFLIGPGVSPFYWYTLKRSFPYVAGVYAMVQVAAAIMQMGSGPDLGQRIGAALGHFPGNCADLLENHDPRIRRRSNSRKDVMCRR